MLGVVLRIGDGLIEVGRVGSGCFSFQLVGLKVVQMLKGRWAFRATKLHLITIMITRKLSLLHLGKCYC